MVTIPYWGQAHVKGHVVWINLVYCDLNSSKLVVKEKNKEKKSSSRRTIQIKQKVTQSN